MSENNFNKIERRDFLKMGSGSFLWLGMKSVAAGGVAGGIEAALAADKNPYNEPIFVALADTIIPGSKTDPTGAPGAIEAQTLEYLNQTAIASKLPVPAGMIRSYIKSALTVKSLWRYQKNFVHLNLEQRTEVARRVEKLPGMGLIFRILRAPFYVACMNRVGYDYVGYPGANQGYADHSFKMEMSPPHPRVVDGNLP